MSYTWDYSLSMYYLALCTYVRLQDLRQTELKEPFPHTDISGLNYQVPSYIEQLAPKHMISFLGKLK